MRRFAILAAVLSALGFSSCTQVLDLRTLVEDRVTLSKVALVLYDGSMPIGPGDTVSWPDTIFGDPAPKILTLTNTGTSNVILSGPSYVSITGGSGRGFIRRHRPARHDDPDARFVHNLFRHLHPSRCGHQLRL